MQEPRPNIQQMHNDDQPTLSNLKIAIILWGDLLIFAAVAVILIIRYS